MQALKCQVCDSIEMTMLDGGMFQCGYCKCKYTKEAVRNIIHGTVEVVKGDAEKERLLVNIRRQIDLGEYAAAIDTGNALAREYPTEWPAWWELTRAQLAASNDFQTHHNGLDFFQLKDTDAVVKTFRNAIAVADEVSKLQITAEWNKIWGGILSPVLSGKRSIAFQQLISRGFVGEFANDSAKNLCEVCPLFAKIMSDGIACAKALSDAKIGLQILGLNYISPINSTFVRPLHFVYGQSRVVKANDYAFAQQIYYGAPLLTISRGAWPAVLAEIENTIDEMLSDSCCPNCLKRGELNKKLTKCSNCKWKR